MKTSLTTIRIMAALALVAVLIIGYALATKQGSGPEKITMYYGAPDVEEMFDATRGFTSGMYKPRNIETDGSASNVTMLRTQPIKLPAKQLSERLFNRCGLVFSHELMTLEGYFTSQPDLSQRYRYAYSAFISRRTIR